MASINDLKLAALKASTNLEGSISDLEKADLLIAVDPYIGSIPDMWSRFLRDLGYTGSFIDMLNSYLIYKGYTTGSISDKLYQYWADGLTPSLEGSGSSPDYRGTLVVALIL